MSKFERSERQIRLEVEAALEGEMAELVIHSQGDTIDVKGQIFVGKGDPEEQREFLELLVEDSLRGYQVNLSGLFVSRGIPINTITYTLKAAQSPDDVYSIEKISDTPPKVRVKVRHQESFLGKKRARINKLYEWLPGVEFELRPLGSQFDVSTLRTLPLLHEWLTPLLKGSGLSPEKVHTFKPDANSQSLHLVYDADIPPRHLRKLARQLMLRTDVDISFEQKMSRTRARETVEASFRQLNYLEGFHISHQEKTGTFVVTTDTEQKNLPRLQEVCKSLSQLTQARVEVVIDVEKDIMVGRLARSFPEDGILTWIKHIDQDLYEVEALIPFDDGNTRLNAWSDDMEATWGAKIMLSDPFLRAPDFRYRQLRGDDTDTIATRFNRPKAFSPEALALADEMAASFDIEAEARKRRDFRGTPVLSIDPDRTRDIDDALSITALDNGQFEVGIHIADVAHFVPQGSALDHEAMMRSFTTYLKEGEIPVLPFVLANGVCSLHGDTDRLALSVFVHLTPEGDLTHYTVEKTVIHNWARLGYGGAQGMLNGKDHQFAWQVRTLGALSKKMRATRKESGALDLSLEEDPEKESHQLIEEFMLLANECVGRFLREQHPEGLCLYRVHPDVSENSYTALTRLAQHLRLNMVINDQNSMQKALEKTLGTDKFDIIRYHVGRTLEKAVYHVEQLGHGALAKEDYAHFTSPIRRYTDLIIHRLIEDVLYKEQRGGASSYDKEALRPVIDHINHMEIRVDAASFESHRLSDLQFYDGARRTFDGRIVSFMKGRMAIKLHTTDLMVSVPYRDFTARDLMPVAITDELSDKWYTLGDEVKVRTDGVDWNTKQIKAMLARG